MIKSKKSRKKSMANKLTKNVEIPCKTHSKTLFIIGELFCEKNKKLSSFVENPAFSLTFPTFSTYFFTNKLPLIISNLFHYSTKPTNTIINNLIERN